MQLQSRILSGPEWPLPPLPQINNTALRTQVFTHRSFAARPTHVFEDTPSDPSPDNEILEHLGDQVLGLVVTELLHEMYPYLRVGPSTKTRAIVVGNTNLATISVRYRLHDRLRLHLAQSVTLKASPNVQADVFEAYIGGLFRDQGLPAVRDWLRPLFRPYIDEAYRNIRDQHRLPPLGESTNGPLSPSAALLAPGPNPNAAVFGARGGVGVGWGSGERSLSSPPPSPPLPPQNADLPLGHLGLFNQRLQQKSIPIEWRFRDSKDEGTKVTPMWIAEAMVNGEVWGRGRGNTKKAAKNEAAKEGLSRLGWSDSSTYEEQDSSSDHGSDRRGSVSSGGSTPPRTPSISGFNSGSFTFNPNPGAFTFNPNRGPFVPSGQFPTFFPPPTWAPMPNATSRHGRA